MAYGYDLFGWYIGVVPDGSRKRSTSVAPTNTSLTAEPGQMRSNWTGSAWSEMQYVHNDPPLDTAQLANEVDPIQFKMLFTSDERTAIYGLESTNNTIKDFLRLLDDSRLETVNLSAPTTQEGVNYAINAIKDSMSPVYDTAKINERVSEILSGKLPV